MAAIAPKDAQSTAGGDATDPGLADGKVPQPIQNAVATESGAALPDAAAWSTQLGGDVSDARLVTGPKAAAAAASIAAPAFTVGNRVFLGAGVTPADDHVMRHELTHVVQQRGAAMPAPGDLTITSSGDHAEHEAREAEHGGQPQPPRAGTVQIAPIGPMVRMGPGAAPGLPGPPNPQLDAFKYFEKHGKAHITELMQTDMGPMTLETGSPFATWEGSSSKRFVAAFANQL
ncbi:MAG: DUF4157 domain-containing protein, partial [bacterium]